METEYINQVSGMKKIEDLIAADKSNSDFDAVNISASYYEQTGNSAKAKKYLMQLTAIDPWDTDIYLRLLKLYKLNGQLDEAHLMLKKIRQIDPTSGDMKTAETQIT